MLKNLLVVLFVVAPLTMPALSQEPEKPLPPAIAANESQPLGQSSASAEHWDKLALNDNDLRPDPPITGEVDTFPEFTRELVRVQWRNNDPIDLYIARPVGVAKPPVIVYLYGYPGEAVRFLNNSLCKTLTKNGFAAVGFSPMLTGQRYHDVSMKEWFISDLSRSLVGTTHDVEMVINYLNNRADFDMTRIGIFGEGSGGTVALLAASVDTRIKAVDVLNPWGDWPSWMAKSLIVPESERADYEKPEFLKSVAPYDPVDLLPKFNLLPLRVQQNLWDDSKTPSTARDRIAASLPKTADLAQYKNERDYYDKVGNNGKMLDWMYAHLPAAVQGGTGPKGR